MSVGPAGAIARVGEHVTAEIWLVDCEAEALTLESLEDAVPRLSEEEIAQALRMRDAGERGRWRAAHIALRFLLERWAGEDVRGLAFTQAANGKPFLPPPAPSFSLSHSGRLALIGLARSGKIGVDVQEIAPRLISGERRQLIEDYAVRIARGAQLPADRDRRFIQAWTRIEALSKADGQGVGKTLTDAGLSAARAPGLASADMHVEDIALGQGYAAAVAASEWTHGLGEAQAFCDILAGLAGAGREVQGCG